MFLQLPSNELLISNPLAYMVLMLIAAVVFFVKDSRTNCAAKDVAIKALEAKIENVSAKLESYITEDRKAVLDILERATTAIEENTKLLARLEVETKG